ncbi:MULTISPECIES: isopentenyl phosphate kinase [unclassified Haladaptatus]|uniref:isopentenyl phosphate kinase n=1 Tax=unclassified Haladaptatus TaxID=2622732 RepID=UPI00209C395C|nr:MULTISPECIES: isopentenyl phosphate kinase [unclassified Haladaptatus]MCO8245915.1 isopentenyl phosphate kinase [Haladaptatus sp. AB643]MCO8254465.1 isopentenyl phosphate kinase [Haladaptatus sp. AB618]
MSLTVLKLGGSVITDKDRPDTLDGEMLDFVADAVGESKSGDQTDDLVLVHGAGSFGHHHASQHGVSKTVGSSDVAAVIDIHGAMETLDQFVLSRLHERDVPAVPVHPFSVASRDSDANLSLPVKQVATMLGEGFVPVLYGDVVVHEGKGVTIVSGDELVASVARQLDADRVGFCSTVPGVLDEDDAVISEITSYDQVADVIGESESTDVTGGMAGKVNALLELGAPASIFGPDDVRAFLAGEDPGTKIDG